MRESCIGAPVAAARAAGVLLVFGVFCSTLKADTITFNFMTGNTTASGVSALVFAGSPALPPLSVIVTATQGGNVTQSTTAGLGVSGGSGLTNPFRVQNNETLQFDFTPNTVTVDTITFTDIDLSGNDDAAMVVRVTSPTATLFNGAISSTTTGTIALNLASFATAANRTGIKFSVSGVDGNDDFGIGGMKVDFTPAPPSSAVPLPAAAAMGMVLIGGLSIVRGARARRLA